MFNKELLNELASDSPDIIKIKKLVIDAYNKENSANLSIEMGFSKEEEKRIVTWFNLVRLNLSKMNSPKSILLSELLYKKVTVAVPFLSISLSDKVNIISQYHCPICTDEQSYPIIEIPIRIAAISKQAIEKRTGHRQAFEKALKFRLANYKNSFKRGEKLCVHIIFILNKNNRDKDLDNMSKALLDALKGVIFGDDLDIDHLSLIKIKHSGSEIFIKINIRKSSVNLHNDVLIKDFYHSWAGAKFLNLEDFMESLT